MKRKYDEAKELCRYVIFSYSELLTQFEKAVVNEHRLRQKLVNIGNSSDAIYQKIQQQWQSTDPKVANLFAQHSDDRALEKIIAACLERERENIFINRCLKCDKIVASPLAKQCRWCHYSWHSA